MSERIKELPVIEPYPIPKEILKPPMLPFLQFVFKVHQGVCNLACRGCYFYEGADNGLNKETPEMSIETAKLAVERIAEHAQAHGIDTRQLEVRLHGGEPLMNRNLTEIIRAIHEGLPGAKISMQSNGLLVTQELIDELREFNVEIGISLDGDEWGNRNRVLRNGQSSLMRVERALNLLRKEHERQRQENKNLPKGKKKRSMYGPIQWTAPYFMEDEEKPTTEELVERMVASYDYIMQFVPLPVDPKEKDKEILRWDGLDLLFPHANHDDEPFNVEAYGVGAIAVYERWMDQGHAETVYFSLFDSIKNLLDHDDDPSISEVIGLAPLRHVTIYPEGESNGSYRSSDDLKSTYPGADLLGYNLREHKLDEVLTHPQIVARQLGLSALSKTCQVCPVVNECGGGLYAHRYKKGSGFGNPSVYGPPLMMLIEHIKRDMGISGRVM